ncbi:MAG: T9SS type A sorting domain-containing protein [Flavisolibacter sp.]|nr:T9SS type A sorting domain-containing protein [Flavisolibacter sp.]
MKTSNPYVICAVITFLFSVSFVKAQCPDGTTPGGTAFDTTIHFPTGVNSTQVKFPKFDPQTAMLTCVRLIVTITGIVDTVAMQNYSASAQTASFIYNRKDSMAGPGLTPPLTNSFDGNYGPYNLTPYDGVPGAGSDFMAIPKDTVLQQVMVRTLTDSTSISEFYGSDSVAYNYTINVTTSAMITGGSSSSLVLTSAMVNFRLEYCSCPIIVLPFHLKDFNVKKSGTAASIIEWKAADTKESYYYQVEVSRDGASFNTLGHLNKKGQDQVYHYSFLHKIEEGEKGKYFYRVKQWHINGTYRYSDIKMVDFSHGSNHNIQLFPNPSSGTAGLKFISVKPGKYAVYVMNAQGQMMQYKMVQVAAVDYVPVSVLKKGVYYIKVVHADTAESEIMQLLVQ